MKVARKHLSSAHYTGMRIALLSPMHPKIGGMATQAERLASCLESEGIEVRRIPVRDDFASWKDRFPIIRTVHQYHQRLQRLARIANSIDGVILCSCSGLYFDLVTMPIIRWCVKRRIPVVLSHRGGSTEDWLRRSCRARHIFSKAAFSCAGVHVSSPYLAQILASYGIHSMAVPIIVDTSLFQYRPRPAKAGVIVNIRSMGRFHGGPLTIQTFAKLSYIYPDSSLTLAGMGSDFKRCRNLAHRLGIEDRIQFPGKLSAHNIANLLNQADLFLNTSSTDNIPNAILEAFASGVPVVSSAVGGIPYLIGRDERGFLVSALTSEDFFITMKQAISDPDGTLSKVSKAREWVESFTWPALKQAYLTAVLEPLTTGKTNSSIQFWRQS